MGAAAEAEVALVEQHSETTSEAEVAAEAA